MEATNSLICFDTQWVGPEIKRNYQYLQVNAGRLELVGWWVYEPWDVHTSTTQLTLVCDGKSLAIHGRIAKWFIKKLDLPFLNYHQPPLFGYQLISLTNDVGLKAGY